MSRTPSARQTPEPNRKTPSGFNSRSASPVVVLPQKQNYCYVVALLIIIFSVVIWILAYTVSNYDKDNNRSMVEKVLRFGDAHPDIAGLFVFWGLCVIAYIINVIMRVRARNLAPRVIDHLAKSKNKMCLIDDAKKHLQKDTFISFFSWKYIENIIGKSKNVRTVKMEYSKPFWCLEGK